MESKANLENNESSGAKNVYRTSWSLQLSTANISRNDTLTVKPEILKVINKFNGGMAYKARGQTYVLSEYMIDGYPFLVVFHLDEGKSRESPEKEVRIPDKIKSQIEVASRHIVQNIEVPEKLHSTEIEVTEPMAKEINLQDGWSLAKAILKISTKGFSALLRCDVDGPCGYCCDTRGFDDDLGKLVNLPKLDDSILM